MNYQHILDAREQKIALIKSSLEDDFYIIVVKANIMGEQKQISEAYLLTNIFYHEVIKKIHIESYQQYHSADGPFILLNIRKCNVIKTKKMLIEIEDSHPLGRLIDLDLYSSVKSVSRADLNMSQRKCLLCDQDAIWCQRNKTHTYEELNFQLKNLVKSYLISHIEKQVNLAIDMELNLENKFGLVTASSMGSHHDMDYQLMIKAKKAILPFLPIFLLGYEQHESKDIMEKARTIGIKAEQAMLNATNGINAYKGLIFVLGTIILASGISLKKPSFKHNLFEISKNLTKSFLDDFIKESDTFGYKAYQTYNILGVRGEVTSGYQTLQKVSIKYPYQTTYTDHDLRSILIEFIILSEDTVFLKRSGSYENYLAYKKLFKEIDPNDIDQIKKLTLFCIEKQLSFGGSADLLITYLYLNYFDQNYQT